METGIHTPLSPPLTLVELQLLAPYCSCPICTKKQFGGCKCCFGCLKSGLNGDLDSPHDEYVRVARQKIIDLYFKPK
jgi:hypothetical protein